MQISANGLHQIEIDESGSYLKADLIPYLDQKGLVTIGWGHVIIDKGAQLRGASGLARAKAIYPHGITQAQAEALMQADLASFEQHVSSLVPADTTQDQFDAMVSLSFNIGQEAFRTSTVCRLHCAGQRSSPLTQAEAKDQAGLSIAPTNAADAFLDWDMITVSGKKVVDSGLLTRRCAERSIYISGSIDAGAADTVSRTGSKHPSLFDRIFG